MSPCPFHGLDYFANENIVLLLSTIPLQFILHRVYFSALSRKVTEQSVLLPLSKTVSNIDNDVGSSENKSKNLKLFLINFERSIAILKILTNVDQR